MSIRNTGKKATGSHNTVIFVIVILTFIGSSLLFWRVNTGVLRQSIEAETNLFAAFLAEDILNEVPEQGEFRNRPEEKLTGVLNSVGDRIDDSMENDSDVWILDTNGYVLAGKELRAGSAASAIKSGGKRRAIAESLDLEILRKLGKRNSYTYWIGPQDFILLRQNCCVVRPLYGGKLYLVVENLGFDGMALQRQQFALLMSIDLFLLMIMVVLIVNNNNRYRRQIMRIATTDELTGLANRKYFNLEFEEYSNGPQRSEAALFLLDIDYFKQINDNYGHAAGDLALRSLGLEIREMVSRLGGFAGRWGGDEFIGVLFLPLDEARRELTELCKRIAGKEMEDGFSMTISVGVAHIEGEKDLARITEKADLALYESKENGRNRVSAYTGQQPESMAAGSKTTAVHTVEEALTEAEEMSIPKDTAVGPGSPEGPNLNQLPLLEGTFRERLRGYVRDKLIMSTILGVRWMAPFIAGGGILIALAFLFDSMSVDLSTLSVAERAELGSITDIAATLKNLGGVTFSFMLPVFAGFMAYGIAGEGAFMAGFAGGYMVIDSQSGFVGAMVAGFLAGVITNEMQKFTGIMPKFIQKAAPIIIIPVFNLLLMQILSTLVITPVASAIGEVFTNLLEAAVEQSPVAGGTLAAMMMATDMGGIINKVAYNYGVEGIVSGKTDLMAAVMIGGMVPPIGIFLSTVFFHQKYTEAERDRGPGALFMGLSFITEGALPYVFTDIKHVIPSCMLGSATAGLLSSALGCTLPAPHGGIFVFPVVGHPLQYVLALAMGSAVTALALGLSKYDAGENQNDIDLAE